MESKTDGSRIKIKMIYTEDNHHGNILKTRKKNYVLYLEDALGDNLGVLVLEDKKDKLCSFKAVRKVLVVNRHKQKEQLIASYHNARWMSPKLINVITMSSRIVKPLRHPSISSAVSDWSMVSMSYFTIFFSSPATMFCSLPHVE